MFVSSSRYNTDISALRDESQSLLGTLDAFKNTMAYAIYKSDGQCTFASPALLSILDYPNSTVASFSHAAMRIEGVEPESEYRSFWQHLVNGGSFSDTVARKSALGETKWLKASYVSVNKSGSTEIHAIYHDITEHENAYFAGKAVTDALNKSMAVIEFHPDGTIITANENFTATVKYSLADIQGKHHRMFCRDKFYQENPTFWDNLARGNFSSGQFERVDSHGNALWLEATYNPVFDASGRVVKVIKFASNITDAVNEKHAIAQAAELAVSTAEETSQIAADGADQGRGFAVVADEVRQLAQRTSDSTVEIESVVAENRKLADKSTKKMAGVKDSVDQNSQQIAQVQSIIDEIQKGALNVSETVSGILR